MPKSDIVVVGSSNTDMIVKVPRLPRPGETVLGGDFMTAAGGKGANQAVAAARAGGSVALVARVGKDSLGDRAIDGFLDEGIDVGHVSRDPRLPSGAALIVVSSMGENSIAVASGANAALSPAHVRKARPQLARAKLLLMQLEVPLVTVGASARFASARGLTVILNPAPAQRLPDELLRHVSILTPNESEAEFLSGVKVNSVGSAQRAAIKLLRRGLQTVVVTLGAKGALVVRGDGSEHFPGFKVAPVDTTAAGDTFNGVLAVALSQNRPLEDAVRMANAAAAISVTRPGAQPSAPQRSEIEKFLKRHSRD